MKVFFLVMWSTLTLHLLLVLLLVVSRLLLLHHVRHFFLLLAPGRGITIIHQGQQAVKHGCRYIIHLSSAPHFLRIHVITRTLLLLLLVFFLVTFFFLVFLGLFLLFLALILLLLLLSSSSCHLCSSFCAF